MTIQLAEKPGKQRRSFGFLFLTALMWCTAATVGYSQGAPSNPHTIRIAFQNKQLSYDVNAFNAIKPGDFYRVVIDSIHLGLYKVSIGKTDSVVQPAELENPLTRLDLELAGQLVAKFGSLGGILGVIEAFKAESLLDGSDEKLQKQGSRTGSPVSDSIRVANTKKQVAELIQTFQNRLTAVFDTATEIKGQIESWKTGFYTQLDSNRLERSSNRTPMPLRSVPDAVERYRRMVLEEIGDLNRAIVAYRSQYEALIAKIPEKDRAPFAAEHQKIQAAHDELLKVFLALEKSVDAETAKSMTGKLVYAHNNPFGAYTSLPRQFTGEINRLEIKIAPRNDSLGLQEYSTAIIFPIRKPKHYFGVSSGFYLSSLHDEAYSVQQVIALQDTSYRLVAETPGKFEIGLNAMFRIGFPARDTEGLSFQLGFGPGITLTNRVRPRFLLGLGAAYGAKNKLLIDVGLIIGPSDRLSIVFKEGVDVPEAPKDYTVSAMRVGGYISFGYLLSR